MPFGRRSPLEALALPGVILAYKYSQFRQRRREAASRRVTERELSALHHKIDKLLNKLEGSEPEQPTSQEDECVICINARATMQTSPCGHRVVCRRCFVKTIQSAVAQRMLPLRCVICRARINRLISSSGTWRIQESASNYSVGTTKSWTAPGTSKSAGLRVTQSASLYSMSSGSSNVSGISYSSNKSSSSGASSSTNNSDTSGTYSTSSLSSSAQLRTHNSENRRYHDGCGGNCLGAIPRNSQQVSCQKPTIQQNAPQMQPIYNNKRSLNHYTAKVRMADIQNRLPPIKEFRSPTKIPMPSPAKIYPMNPRQRFASYTAQQPKSASTALDTVPLLDNNIKPAVQSAGPKISLTAKVAPIKTKTSAIRTMTPVEKPVAPTPSTSRSFFILPLGKCGKRSTLIGGQSNTKADTVASKIDERMTDENKKNEFSAEKRKKEEKLRLKAEKEAKKEEKKQAKEEKKRGKKDVKYFSLICDNSKTDTKSKK